MALWRTTAMVCGPDPVRSRTGSSWKTTARTRCRRLSIRHCARTAAAKVLASSLAEERWQRRSCSIRPARSTLRPDRADHRRTRHARLIRVAAIRGEPAHVMAYAGAAAFEAAMIVVGCLVRLHDQVARIGEDAPDV
ncbi:hypothetical protein, partial [Methylobacterium tarhaniae]|uniref:hypothetical protein n=1 Tax=Methylobacterium tarhaniae TaxID=1187852 RepID=UPI003CFC77F0